MRVSLQEAEEYIAMVDQDNDGMLNYGEFVTLFTEKIGFWSQDLDLGTFTVEDRKMLCKIYYWSNQAIH